MPTERTVKTDADGAFILELPKESSHVLTAKAERTIGDNTEKYYWLTPVSFTGTDEQKSLFLSNDNLLDGVPKRSNVLNGYLPEDPHFIPDIEIVTSTRWMQQ
jgi:hypothetical protein